MYRILALTRGSAREDCTTATSCAEVAMSITFGGVLDRPQGTTYGCSCRFPLSDSYMLRLSIWFTRFLYMIRQGREESLTRFPGNDHEPENSAPCKLRCVA